MRWILLFSLVCALPIVAQEEVLHGSHKVEARFDPLTAPDISTAFDDGPFVLPKYLGALSIQCGFELESGNVEAQRWFRQGLVFYHHGEMVEAERAFRRVLVEDESAAIAFLGLGLANECIPGRAAMFVRRAASLVESKDGVEAGLIAAYNKFYKDLRGDVETRSARLLRDLENLAMAHPQAVEIRALVVRMLAEPESPSPLAVEALISQVLAVTPGHPVAGYRAELWADRDEARAVAAIEGLLERAALKAATWFRAARLNERVGRRDLAIGCFHLGATDEFAQSLRMNWNGELPQKGAVSESMSLMRRLTSPLPRALEILELYGAGDKASAFRLFDRNFRYSCSFSDVPDGLDEIAAEMKLPKNWVLKADRGLGFEGIGRLVSFSEDPPAPKWRLPEEDGVVASSDDFAGKTHVMIFFLGAGCEHCMGQLEGFAKNVKAFQKAGIELVAISSDDLNGLEKTRRAKTGAMFPFPILADPKLGVFQRYFAFDQFENEPLHATVVVNGAEDILWRHVGGEPFHDIGVVIDTARKTSKEK